MRKKILLMTFLTLLLTAMGTGALYAQDNVVTIGTEEGGYTPALSNCVPIRNNYEQSISQQYYWANEIGKTSGTITSVSFMAGPQNGTSTDGIDDYPTTRSLEVYMKNVDETCFNTISDGSLDKTMITLSTNDLVFSGNITFIAEQWNDIEIPNGFEYDGRNILLCVVDKTSSYISGVDAFFKCFEWMEIMEINQQNSVNVSRSLYKTNTSKTAHFNPTSAIDKCSQSFNVPCVQFTFEVPTQFEGEGTEESPYIIADIDDLSNLRNKVNEGETYVGKYFKLTEDITLTGEWTPIGNGSRSSSTYTGNAFKGVFDGNEKTIDGLNIANGSSDETKGLFGVVDGGTVKNLKLTNVDISTSSKNVGAAAGLMVNNATIDKVEVSGTLEAPDGVGGIVGRMIIDGTISNCTNNAEVTATTAAGGIVGKAYYSALNKTMNITDCTNKGNITGSYAAGGIAALSAANISGCSNIAVIASNEAGGIVGEQIMYGTINNNVNSGLIKNINNDGFAHGGIIGWVRYHESTTNYPLNGIINVTNNTNTANIEATGAAGGSGGIVGHIYNQANVTGNTNKAEHIYGGAFAAGIAGSLQQENNNLDIENTTITVSNNISLTSIENITVAGLCKNLFAYNNDAANFVVKDNLSNPPVAQIGDVAYETLQDAFDAVLDGETITLIDDVTVSVATAAYNDGTYIDGVRYTGDKSFTVDFNGKTVTDDGCVNDYLIYINNKGEKASEITFTNGTIVSANGCWSAVCVNSSAATQNVELNLNGMNITNSNDAVYSGNPVVRARDLATVNVNEGTIITSNGASYGVAANTDGSTVNINEGATIIQQNSGTTGGNSVFAAVGGKGVINIKGGTITSDKFGVHTMTTGTPVINISGGTITAPVALKSSTNGGNGELATINVTGGTINGTLETYTDNGKIVVSGGTFSEAVAEEYCADGFVPVENADGTYGVVVDPAYGKVAKIGDNYYATLAEAVAEATEGETITMLADAAEDVTIPAGVSFNGNGKAVGNITAAGTITFNGHTKATSFNVEYTNTTVNIVEGACLEITGTGRMVIGHGCTFNVTGSIEDAKTADKATLTPSLIMPGASFTGAGVTFNVTNAYVKTISSYCSSKNSNANSTFDFNIENSIWEQYGSLVFSEPTNGMDPTVNFELKNSVLNSTSHLVFSVTKGEVVIDNSNVNVDNPQQIENRSTMIVKNGSVVNGAVATSSNAKNPGTIIVEGATYAVTGEFSGSDLGTGTIVYKNGATISAGSITKANIQIDATGMKAGDEVNITANLANLAGTIEVINNNMLDAKIVDGKIVIVEKTLDGEGTEASPYVITNLDDLKFFRDHVNAGNNYAGKHVKLADNIDLSSIENWTPIGDITYDNKYQPADNTKVFSGVFNGNDKVISKLTINRTVGGADTQANVGLFGITGEGSVIKNLTLSDVNITTDGRNVGALAGFAYKATLDNITVNGEININGGNNVSGVAGMTRYHAMSATNIKVIGNDDSAIVGNNIVGGIFAEIAPNGSEQTFENLSVENVAITGVGGVGGIVGLLTTGAVDNVTVKNVVLTGRTDYQGNAMGRIRLGSIAGLMGGQYATIANVTVENVTAKNLDNTQIEDLPIIGANYDASSNATEAKIGDTYYATLAKAYDAAEANQTITLLSNIETSVTVDKSVVLDLNGKTITSSDITVTVDGGELTVFDNTEDKSGKIISTHASGNEAVAVKNGGKFTLESGNIEGASYGVYLYTTGGTGIINGGTITIGGEYKDGMTVAVASDKCSLTVTGGTFTANGVNYPIYTWSENTIALKGGMFDFNPNIDYIAKGYAAEAVADKDGWFRVVAVEPMITIEGGESFYTLSEAFAAAKENDVIVINRAGEYKWPNTAIPAGVTIEANVEDVVVSSNTQACENIIDATTLTVKNVDFKDANKAAFVGNGKAKNLTFIDCSFTGLYAFHVDAAATGAELNFNNCEFNGFTTFATTVETINFDGGSVNGALIIRQDATIEEVVFSEEAAIQMGTTDVVTGKDITIAECTVEDTDGDGTTPNVDELINDNGNGADDKGNTVVVDDVVIYGGVAKIEKDGETTRFASLADAATAAQDGETIQLIWAEGNDPISMAASFYGKNVTITGTATVNWSTGWFFVGRGGEGNATVTFDGANLTSSATTNANSGLGIHVSGRQKNTDNKYDGKLVIKNSTIELDYLIDRGTITIDNATLTVKNGFGIAGRPATETESGENATATISLENGAKLIVNNHNGMGVGQAASELEGYGIMNIDATSTFETTQSFNISANGTMNVNGGNVKVVGTLTNAGTVYVTGAANLDANVTGNGWFYMNGVALDADTKLSGAKVGFINGENTIVGSTIDNGFFSVGIGQNAAATTAAAFAGANGITLGDVTVNVSENAIIGGNGETYSGWVGSAYSADKTQHTYTLNVENSLAAFGYMHVSKDGIMNINGRSADDNKYTQDNSNVNFYAGDLIVNGNVTIYNADAWVRYTKMSVDHADGVLNITGDTNYESSIHNGSTTGTSLVFYNAGKVNIDATSNVEIDNKTTLVEGAELNIASANVIAKGDVDVTGNGAINFTALTAKLTAQEGLTIVDKVNDPDYAIAYLDGTYQYAKYVAQIGEAKYITLQEAIDAAQNDETITLLVDVEQADGVIIDSKNIVVDLNEKTFTVTKGANTNNRNFRIIGTSVVTIKNGTMYAKGDYSSGAYGTVRTEGTANVTLDDLKLYNYRGNGLNIKANSGTTVNISNTEIYSEYGGGIEAAGGIITLAETVKVEQKGMYTAPYNSMAISVNSGGLVTVNGGTYSTECITAEEANNQGTSHGPWVVGVLNSGGTLIINGGTFSNDNYGDNSLATAARGAVLADTKANVQINGGTFNALKAIIDIQNNLGDQNNNPSALLSGGTFSADPRISASYGSNLIVVADGYSVVENEDDTYSVVEDQVAKIGDVTYKLLHEAFDAAQDGDEIVVLKDIVLTEGITVAADKTVALDLNGKTITGTPAEAKAFAVITNKGNLTITDGTETEGKIVCDHKLAGSTEYAVNTITNSGTLTIVAGTIQNTSTASNQIGYAIDNNSTTGNTILVIEGDSKVTASGSGYYDGIRQFCNSETNENSVTIKGGEVSSLWLQNPSDGSGTQNTKDVKGSFAINGGTLNNLYLEPSTQFAGAITGGHVGNISRFQTAEGRDLEGFITGGTFSVDPSDYCAEGYSAKDNGNGTYSVIMTSGTQEIALALGWNWFSSYIDLSGETGLEKVQTALGTNGVQIKGKFNNNSSSYQDLGNGTSAWIGDFDLSTKQMYMINTSAAVTMEITGNVVDREETTISLGAGWNWISYPLYETLDINEALANHNTADDGDAIKTLDKTSVYYSTLDKWIGDLTELTPGQGYMYKSANATSFVYSAGSSRSAKSDAVSENKFWKSNANKFANNMTVVAMLSIDGEIVNDNYEIAAFANGECRGSARPVYVEELDQYILFLTINGEDVQELTFKYYDVNYGTVYELNNRINYSNDAVLGSIDEPYMFNLGILNIEEATLSDINIYPNPTTTGKEINLEATCDKVEVFNALGVKVAEYSNVDSIDAIETAGIYVIRVTIDGDARNCRLVVK